MARRRQQFLVNSSAGLVSGLVAGAVMGLVAMARSESAGMGFWLPMHEIAATLYGVDALLGGIGVTFVGVLVHLALAACFGWVFAMYTWRLNPGWSFLAGLAAGGAGWFLMTFLILPWADPVMQARVALIPGWWFIDHLIFGGMLFLTPILSTAGRKPVQPADPVAPR